MQIWAENANFPQQEKLLIVLMIFTRITTTHVLVREVQVQKRMLTYPVEEQFYFALQSPALHLRQHYRLQTKLTSGINTVN